MKIYTIGYEGKSFGQFADGLEERGVEVLVDVRELPLSRKAGFSKRGLAAALAERGVKYVHMRGLGTPRGLRRQLREDGNYGAFFARYEEHLRDRKPDLEALVEAAGEKVHCLMCFEADPRQCHRSVLAAKLAERGFAVQHI